MTVDITLCFLFKYLFMLATVYSLYRQTVPVRDHYRCILVMLNDRKSKLLSLTDLRVFKQMHSKLHAGSSCTALWLITTDNDSDISNLQRIDPIHWLIALLYLESVNDWLN